MIKAKEAKEKTLSNSVEFFINSIEAEILKGISDNRFHCIWYTPPIYNCTKEDLVKIAIFNSHNFLLLSFKERIIFIKFSHTVFTAADRFRTA